MHNAIMILPFVVILSFRLVYPATRGFIMKSRRTCVKCLTKWDIEFDEKKPVVIKILCPDCRTK